MKAIDELIDHCNANPTKLCIVGHTYTFLGIPPAWVRGKVVAENLVCIVLAPGAQRLGDASNGEQDYENLKTVYPAFKQPIVLLKSPQIQLIHHGEL
jgi:hypothetical protein